MPEMTNQIGDVTDVPEPLTGFMGDRGWSLTEAAATEVSEDLKGKALDEALEEAGLPKSGSADEKRARYAEWLAERNDSDTDPAEEQS